MSRMRLIAGGVMAVLMASAGWATLPLDSKTEAAMQEGSTQPLYTFSSSKGYRLYKTTDQGMSACENLREQDKPIKCTSAGKLQP